MAKKTILVTGSAGFIGFHVAKRLLEEGYTVIGIDNFSPYYSLELKKDRNRILQTFDSYIFYKTDIINDKKIQNVLHEHKIQTICHLAAQAGVRYSLEKPLAYESSNVQGFLTILENAKKYNIPHIVYASSSSVYGNNTMPKKGFSERDPVNEPISVYGATKRADELLAYTYHSLYGMKMTGLRFFTVYGPWGRPDMSYYKFVEAIIQETPIEIYNNGKMKRDFTYIDDIVEGVISAIYTPFANEIFNLGNSHTIELSYFISCLEKELGKKAKKKFKPLQPGDLIHTFANIEKAKKYLHFHPKISVEKGLKNFVEWYTMYKKL